MGCFRCCCCCCIAHHNHHLRDDDDDGYYGNYVLSIFFFERKRNDDDQEAATIFYLLLLFFGLWSVVNVHHRQYTMYNDDDDHDMNHQGICIIRWIIIIKPRNNRNRKKHLHDSVDGWRLKNLYLYLPLPKCLSSSHLDLMLGFVIISFACLFVCLVVFSWLLFVDG